MKLIDIKVGKRFRKDIGDLKTLKNSIKELGLLQPIVIDENNNLIAGYRRFLAHKELGLKEIKVNVVKIENSLRGEFDENTIRKNFTPSESVAIWGALESRQGQLRSESDRSSDRPMFIGAKLTGTSHDTLSKAKQVLEFGNEKWIEEMDRTGNVNKLYRMVKQKKDQEKILKEKPKLEAEGKFKTIVIDPPWQYETNVIGRTQPEYSTMSIEELEELKLPADENCHLYLWTTNAFLPKALDLGKVWGFEYKTCITWVKPQIGMGSYFRNSTEHCLFFIKGHLSTRVKNIPTHFVVKRTKHSEKPDEMYKIIEKASFPPYLEIFARKKRTGWKTTGNL